MEPEFHDYDSDFFLNRLEHIKRVFNVFYRSLEPVLETDPALFAECMRLKQSLYNALDEVCEGVLVMLNELQSEIH